MKTFVTAGAVTLGLFATASLGYAQDLAVNGNLSVTGATTLNNDLSVNNNGNFFVGDGSAGSTSSAYIDSGLTVTGQNLGAGATALNVNAGGATIFGNTTINGVTTLNGGVTGGLATDTLDAASGLLQAGVTAGLVQVNGNLAATNAQFGNANIATVNATTANLTNANLTNATIGTETVTTAHVTTATIGTANVTTENVTTDNIGTANITTANVTTATIGTANITTENVTNANLTNATIGTANITNGNVTNANVTNLKLGANTVTGIATGVGNNANLTTQGYVDSEVGSENSRALRSEAKLRRGIAIAAALETPTIEAGKDNAVKLSAGEVDGTGAISFGYARRVWENVSADLSVSTDTSFHDQAVRGGINYSF